MKIKATILVLPIGKARPRHRQLKDGRIIDYLPEPTLTTQGMIQVHIRNTVMRQGSFPQGIPLKMAATFYRPRPKSAPKKLLKPVTKPDWDNYGKLVSDALNKFVYHDDSQITTAVIKKRYGNPPRIELALEEDLDE